MSREWRLYLDEMIRCAETALGYTQGMEFPDFLANRLVYDATVRNIELIGEAASHIPDSVREAQPDIEWRMVIATRNRLIHGYSSIDDRILWSILRDSLPGLLEKLRALQGA